MQIQLSNLLKGFEEVIAVDTACDLSETEVWGEHPFLQPVAVQGEIRNRAGLVNLSLSVSAPVDSVCARCLQPVHETLSFQIDYDLVTELQNPDDDRLLLVEGGVLDLDDTVRSAVLLNMPMRFLCKEDCKGLCPQCGTNWNEKTCGCKNDKVDPRLAILKSLL